MNVNFQPEKEGNSDFCDNRDEPEDIMLSDITKTGKDKYCMFSHIYTGF